MNNANVEISVNVNIGGLGLALVNLFGGGKSVMQLVLGGSNFGPAAQLEPWVDKAHGPLGHLLGGTELVGQKVDQFSDLPLDLK